MIQPRGAIADIRPYSPGKPIDEVRRELGLDTVYKLASNENPLGPPASAVDAMGVAALKASLYPDANAYELRTALAESLQVKPEQLVFGDGSNELIKLLAISYLQPGDEIIAPSPSFGEYLRTATVAGASVKLISLKDYTNDLPAMAAAISTKTRMIYVCNPNNPTGTVVNESQMRQFMRRVGDEILVVLDEAYYEYVADPNSPQGLDLCRRHPNVISLRTFSKAYGLAGLRVGYGVAAPEIVETLNKVREPFNVNALAQAAALAALGDKEYLKKSVEFNRVERDYLTQELQALGLEVIPSQANFVLTDLGRDCNEVFKLLLAQGVITRTGDIFGYPTKLRVSIGLREENNAFLSALKAILAPEATPDDEAPAPEEVAAPEEAPVPEEGPDPTSED